MSIDVKEPKRVDRGGPVPEFELHQEDHFVVEVVLLRDSVHKSNHRASSAYPSRAFMSMVHEELTRCRRLRHPLAEQTAARQPIHVRSELPAGSLGSVRWFVECRVKDRICIRRVHDATLGGQPPT
ncbi:hypothetical protein H310_14734 [Aphanomyces invadans]|uniref:Uncharacterized protein n=1 Tax=Aphanomyces invadans TaxID=157072 RepID=A0A024T937_9STRA|nr:hypothetical protein H310_14734 [Aphanomyces invadans]ETV90494.1 hypothetical protein H310_14734 [Aphanomyces invadans]|eukprot:XP_008880882.1 hypothetical protein H310_14734 [Aphanomyces invadans]